ncbi:flagellar motor protein MotB [Candidatus Endoriftia persephone str. Guaymas]|jgi:chemotaxis protein MotB|uniref:Flagellar motor rotation protein MotB n=3 Tax=Gammaproteobacteria TaxID=1236 RepID=G2FHG5_9GAMM|nr:type VI secretion system protein TssL, long form [Candidatus Endoriftia persephone]EGV51916.1 flagellar motor rotation protein motB [endosymbiont of Riftia pachyptila (vent Ph05)]EGW53725.1 flagellar motor rotation protein MotB [endosymbiont of Tevnia jerichonana (vent Tica)]MBA1332674.1 flagellar motor protein MotB [Candidatus Endoriftia persephone str. Guaymas]USF86425.1 type VI secretion system protein TssL, long form [Candidatus Endoriftia persephone]
MAEECPKCEAGLPAWLATFADLMSLLMCFFVLLLSFATIDAVRFKKMAESMKDAFGVQREIPANEIVKGVSVIKQEFSTGKPEPTVIDEIRQITTDEEQENLEVNESKEQAEKDVEVDQQMREAVLEQIEAEVKEQAEELKMMLDKEIDEGMLEVETEATKIIIRIQEKGSFGSGRATLNPGFFDVISKITKVIAATPGKVVVAGHTDDIPISTKRFRSNWELSSARAVTVVHAMLSNHGLDPSRVSVEGHADSSPLVPNDSWANRAKNRRVELIIERGSDSDLGVQTIDAIR